MDRADNSALKDFFVTLASPEVLAEIIAIVIASLIAVAGTHAVRNWHKKHAPPGPDAGTGARRFSRAACWWRPTSSRPW